MKLPQYQKTKLVNLYYNLMAESLSDDYNESASLMIYKFYQVTGKHCSLAEISQYISKWKGY